LLDDYGYVGSIDNFNISGNMPLNSSTGSVSFIGDYNPYEGKQPKEWAADIKGTSSTGGAFVGIAGGPIGSWKGRSSSFYVESGNIGFLNMDLIGTIEGGKFITNTGVMEKVFYGTTSIPGSGETLANNIITSQSMFSPPVPFEWNLGNGVIITYDPSKGKKNMADLL